jgi:hypothetical protein
MSRAWPFEDKSEPPQQLRNPAEFAAASGDGTDAVVVRIGLRDAQLVLVDADGRWMRWVYPTVEDAMKVAEELGLPLHSGEYPEAVRVRMNARRRPPEEFDRAAYPEQGEVGPVIPYRENRPRQAEAVAREADPRKA